MPQNYYAAFPEVSFLLATDYAKKYLLTRKRPRGNEKNLEAFPRFEPGLQGRLDRTLTTKPTFFQLISLSFERLI